MAAIPDVVPSQPRRPSILRSQSTSDVSTSSSDSKSHSISFAPLPEIAPRKRRNTRPIGLASRAEMLRKSRRQYGAPMYDDHHGPPPEEEEIPLPDIGKLVKGIWRSVSRSHGKDKNARATQLAVPPNTKEDVPPSGDAGEDVVDGWMEQVAWESVLDTCSPSLHPDPIRRDPNDTMSTLDSATFLDEYDRNASEARIHHLTLHESKEACAK